MYRVGTSRHSMLPLKHLDRVDTGTNKQSADYPQILPARDRSVYIKSSTSSRTVVQTTRPRSSVSRCLSARLEQLEELHTSSCQSPLRIVGKFRDDKSTALVLAPKWPNRPWYPQLVQMLLCSNSSTCFLRWTLER